MTATLHFDLSNQDDADAFLRANKALDMALFIWELQVNILSRDKTIDEIIEKVNQELDNRGINIELLVS